MAESAKIYRLTVAEMDFEYFHVKAPGRTDHDNAIFGLLRKYHDTLAIPYNAPESKLGITISEERIENGEKVYKHCAYREVSAPRQRMNSEDFTKKMDEILAEIPTAFREFVSSQAWDRGHSSGFEEVCSIAQDLTDSLKPAIKAYRGC